MTVPISYPGVYITEIPSGSRTIVGVATSITAFVGAASRGPADVPVTIFSFADFERTFGGLSRTSGLGYAVRDFYQNGGGEALIVRLAHMSRRKDGKVIEDDPTNAATATLDVDGLLTFAAIGPGTWGNALQVEVSYPSAADARGRRAGPGRRRRRSVLAGGAGRRAERRRAGGDLFQRHRGRRPGPGHGSPRRLPAGAGRGDRRGSPRIAPIRARGDPRNGFSDGTVGRDGGPLVETDYVPTDATKPGIDALLQADLFNLLCIPPPTLETGVDTAVWIAAKALCFKQRAFLIVDPPLNSDLTA